MITPNKFTPYDKSILSKLKHILRLEENEIDIFILYKKVSSQFSDINEFIFALDVLYVLSCIEVDFITRKVIYVNRN